MSVSTQNHHILPTATFGVFEADIMSWTNGDYKNNAGYNRIELPTNVSGANGQVLYLTKYSAGFALFSSGPM